MHCACMHSFTFARGMLCTLVSSLCCAAEHMAKITTGWYVALNRKQLVRSMVHLIGGKLHAGDAPKTDRYVVDPQFCLHPSES